MIVLISIITLIVGFLIGYWLCASIVRIQLAKSNEENIKKLSEFGNHMEELEKIVTNGR